MPPAFQAVKKSLQFFDRLYPVTFLLFTGQKSPRSARRNPCCARVTGDIISLEAGCRPLELPCPGLKQIPRIRGFRT